MNSEAQLIERIMRGIPPAKRRKGRLLRLGIGDDAAMIAPRENTEWALSCDASLEDVHFSPKIHPADSVGFKSLVRATSDLVAMGATPRLFLLTLALPASRTGAWLDDFMRGMNRAARLLHMLLAGGDTTHNSTVSISITVLGEIDPGLAITRSGARPGDVIYVSGKLGRAQLGLELVRGGFGRDKRFRRCLQQHLYPRIRPDLGAWLAQHRVASAMLDLSDGLSTDLSRLCTASGVGARVWTSCIPCTRVPAAPSGKLNKMKLNPLQMAL